LSEAATPLLQQVEEQVIDIGQEREISKVSRISHNIDELEIDSEDEISQIENDAALILTHIDHEEEPQAMPDEEEDILDLGDIPPLEEDIPVLEQKEPPGASKSQ